MLTDRTALAPAEALAILTPLLGRRVLLAVSGGGDSTALLWLAARLQRGFPEFSPAVATVDHRLRPGSADEAAAVGALCRRLGLPHAILAWEGAKPAADLQAAARAARYGLLAAHAARLGCDAVATAHTLEDQAETVLLRLGHGSGVDGLAAMPASRPLTPGGPALLRPLLGVPRARLRATLAAAGVAWTEDPSNDDDRFARVRLRRLAPALAAEGMTAPRLARTAERAARAVAALEAACDDLCRAAITTDVAGFAAVDVRRLDAAPDEIAIRALGRAVAFAGGRGAPRLEALEAAHAALVGSGDGPGRRTLGGAVLDRRGGRMWIYREARRPPPPAVALEPGGSAVWDRRFRIALSPAAASGVVVGPLGRRHPADGRAPVAAFATTPAAFRRDEPVAIPGLGYYADASWLGALTCVPVSVLAGARGG